MKTGPFALAGALLLLILAMALKGQLIGMPDVRAAPAAGAFDTGRAIERLRRILGDQRPHPVDSAANDAVRERLLAEMRAVGLNPQVSDDFACNSHPRVAAASCARVRNIVATIGPREGSHLLAAAHYDSSPVGAGAADDGIGVATLLEIAAQLRGAPLRRPLTFLITDGEEAGLIGARAFIEKHPLAARVDSVVNFEARGVEGQAIMFETSRPNGLALAHFARSAHRPVANSLTADFYRLIPNATDVTVFSERPWTTLNFAIIANETRYHSAGDDLAALDPRSLQHMGDQGLAAVRSLVADEPLEANGGEVHYFDVAGRTLIVLPALFSFLLLGLLILYFGWTAWRRRAGLALAVAGIVSGLIDTAILAWLGHLAVGLLRTGQWWRAHPEAVSLAVTLSALAACALAMVVLRKVSVETLRAAFWLVLLLLAAGPAFVAPGGTILFVFPPLIAAIGLGTRFERAAAIAAAALLFLLLAPLLDLVETLLGHGGAWAWAPLAAIILWPWLIELKPRFAALRLRALLGGAALLFIAGWAVPALVPAYSEDRQQRFSVEHGWDADSGEARWAILNDGAPLPEGFPGGSWTSGAEVPWGLAPRWVAPAPAGPRLAPSLSLVEQRETPQGRAVTVRVAAPGAQALSLRAPPEARLRSIAAGGFTRVLGEAGEEDPAFVRCSGRSCDGALFTLLLESRAPVEWLVTGWYEGLPEEARPLLAARPPLARPQYSADGTIGYRRQRF